MDQNTDNYIVTNVKQSSNLFVQDSLVLQQTLSALLVQHCQYLHWHQVDQGNLTKYR